MASFNDRLNQGKRSGPTSTIRKRLSLPGGIAEGMTPHTPSVISLLKNTNIPSHLKSSLPPSFPSLSPSLSPLLSPSLSLSPSLALVLPLWQIKPLILLYVIDDLVDGLCKLSNGTQRWYPGRITSTNMDGTYSLRYLDGDVHTNKESNEIRFSKNVKLSSARSSRTSLSSTDCNSQRDHIATMYSNINSINNNSNNSINNSINDSNKNNDNNSNSISNNNNDINNNNDNLNQSELLLTTSSTIKSPFKNNSITMRKRSFRSENLCATTSRLLGVKEQPETPPLDISGDINSVESMNKIVNHIFLLDGPDTPQLPLQIVKINDIDINDNINEFNNDNNYNSHNKLDFQKELQIKLNVKLESKLNLLLNDITSEKDDMKDLDLNLESSKILNVSATENLEINVGPHERMEKDDGNEDKEKDEKNVHIHMSEKNDDSTNMKKEKDVKIDDKIHDKEEEEEEEEGGKKTVEKEGEGKKVEREEGKEEGRTSYQSVSAKSNFSDISVQSPESNHSDEHTFAIPSVFDTPRQELKINGKFIP